jgi:hypothetical protein
MWCTKKASFVADRRRDASGIGAVGAPCGAERELLQTRGEAVKSSRAHAIGEERSGAR